MFLFRMNYYSHYIWNKNQCILNIFHRYHISYNLELSNYKVCMYY